MKILATGINNRKTSAAMSSSPIQHCHKLVLAESQPITFQPLLYRLKKVIPWVKLCSSYIDLLELCDRETPDILLLGTLSDGTNCLEIYRKCRSRWQHLPIVLLANQAEVNDRFRTWAMQQGVDDVVSSYPQAFDQLRDTLEEVANRSLGQHRLETKTFSSHLEPSGPSPTMEFAKALIALNEISEYSQRYFGPLALGNYWKKAHQKAVEVHPWLQQWNVDYWGKIEFSPAQPSQSNFLTVEQLNSLQAWVNAFLEECKRVVIDFPQLLKKKHLSAQVDRLLS